MPKVKITVNNGTHVFSIECPQEAIRFEIQPDGDGIITFPDNDNYIKVVVNKENIL